MRDPFPDLTSKSSLRFGLKLLQQAKKGSLRQAPPEDAEAYAWQQALLRVFLVQMKDREGQVGGRIVAQTILTLTHRGECALVAGSFDNIVIDNATRNRKSFRGGLQRTRTRRCMNAVKRDQRAKSHVQSIIEQTVGDISQCDISDTGWVTIDAWYETNFWKTEKNLRGENKIFSEYATINQFGTSGFDEISTIEAPIKSVGKMIIPEDDHILASGSLSIISLKRYDGGVLLVSVNPLEISDSGLSYYRGIIAASSATMMVHLMLQLR